MRRTAFVVTSVFVAGAWPFAQAPQTTAIRQVRIITIDQGVIENGAIVMEGGRIAALGAKVAIPGGAVVSDGTGLTAMPGSWTRKDPLACFTGSMPSVPCYPTPGDLASPSPAYSVRKERVARPGTRRQLAHRPRLR
jgi:hypothetical protein